MHEYKKEAKEELSKRRREKEKMTKSKKDCCCWESNHAQPANTVQSIYGVNMVETVHKAYTYGRPKPVYGHTDTDRVENFHIRIWLYGVPRYTVFLYV
jgi:hypothetical protein